MLFSRRALQLNGFLAVTGFIVSVQVVAGSQIIDVRILGEHHVTQRGSNITLVCQFRNTSLADFITDSVVLWAHRSRVSGLDKEHVLSESKQKLPAKDSHWNESHFDVQFDDNITRHNLTVNLTINRVDDADDGQYFCRVTNNLNHNVTKKESVTTLVVPRPAENVTMVIDGQNVLTSGLTLHNELTLIQGEHVVNCVARGANPQVNLLLYLDGQMLRNSTDSIAVMETKESILAKAPRYRTELNNVKFTLSSGVTTILCSAVPNLPGIETINVSAKISFSDSGNSSGSLRTLQGWFLTALLLVIASCLQ